MGTHPIRAIRVAKGVDDRLGDGSSQGAGVVCRGLEANVISFMQGCAEVVWAGDGDMDGDKRKALLADWALVSRLANGQGWCDRFGAGG